MMSKCMLSLQCGMSYLTNASERCAASLPCRQIRIGCNDKLNSVFMKLLGLVLLYAA